ncbi:redoxin domain-containing protein [Pedobacter sp. HMF7647]|uniref:Redoxin domain-containing protein n=1 Tax=Hufsiella arboris TaxID=2695275 RepID=A0A7K1Y5Z6_9SPHI|nr:TlpA disulfide reductase family protein [Hufsiella arboris]MXV50004.1 redoxin domain-containing protein [Hufsiella arboris]
MKVVVLLLAALSLVTVSCSNSEKVELKDGIWRAALTTESGAEIPFNFELADSAGKKIIHIINGAERFKVSDISVKDDSVFIRMPLFDSEIRTKFTDGNLSGRWIKHLAAKDSYMAFNAEPGNASRFFKTDDAPKYNVTGRWSTVFVSADGQDTTVAVGEFKQKDAKVTGTFLTTTGDYRFLEGTVTEDKLSLSCFDGSHAFLFTGKINPDNTISEGKFYGGYSSIDNWTAKKDEKAMLPDAYSLTALKPGYDKINFSFPDLNGKKVSLNDPRFHDKVVVVQFMGSWCPNCMDETAYLSPFYNKFKSKGVEVVGLAYERTTDFNKSKRNVESFKKRFDVAYPLLITGFVNDKKEVARSLPMLSNFVAFPTTIIIDKKGLVRKIHTGFSGPGTGNHYTEFMNEFESLINQLITEPKS